MQQTAFTQADSRVIRLKNLSVIGKEELKTVFEHREGLFRPTLGRDVESEFAIKDSIKITKAKRDCVRAILY